MSGGLNLISNISWVIENGFLKEEIESCRKRFWCAGSDNWNEEISFRFGPNWVLDRHQQDDFVKRHDIDIQTKKLD